jgi:tRNA pseudouridine55 synthase
MTEPHGTSDGLLVVDKPGGMTSHDVVARVRRLAGTRRVGHAGTLDPMATGVLVVGIGRATRLLGHLAARDKEYVATIRLGVTTSSDDVQGPVVAEADAAALAAVDDTSIARCMAELTGEIMQVPPVVSAIKVEGVRSYARARTGDAPTLAPRPVTVTRFEVTERRGADLDVHVECSTGTYIRSLARDLGNGLGVGGHISRLRRTRSGRFLVAAARPLDDLDVGAHLLPMAATAAMEFECLAVDADEAERIRHGQRRVVGPPELNPPGVLAVLDELGSLVAVVEVRDGVAHPRAVFG